MPQILIRHKVTDFDKWKFVFYEHGAKRKASGSKGRRIFRNDDDPNELIVIFDWDNQENAKRFIKSRDLHDSMRQAGVSDEPDMYYLD